MRLLGYYRNTYGYVPEDYPNAYACDHLSITLPLYIQMSDEEQRLVVQTMREEIDAM